MHLLMGIQRSMHKIEKVLDEHGQALKDLSLNFAAAKNELAIRSGNPEQESLYSFSPANTLEELAELTNEFKVS